MKRKLQFPFQINPSHNQSHSKYNQITKRFKSLHKSLEEIEFPDDYHKYDMGYAGCPIANLTENPYQGKNVLITFGDSWTDNLYIKDGKKHWAYQLKSLLDYDILVNVSMRRSSNYDIFDSVKFSLCDDEMPMRLQRWVHSVKRLLVVIQWSTPIRDSTTAAEMYAPFDQATVPNLLSYGANVRLWRKWVLEWQRPEVYSYDTQRRALYLQTMFEENSIDWYSFMGFTPMLDPLAQDTRLDITDSIDRSRYLWWTDGWVKSAQDAIIQQRISDWNTPQHLTEQQFETERLPIFRDHPTWFLPDGHPNTEGLEYMARTIHEFIITKKRRKR